MVGTVAFFEAKRDAPGIVRHTPVKLTAKLLLMFGLVGLVMLTANTYFRIEREAELFDSDMRKDAAAHALSIAHAAALVAENQGTGRAKQMVKRAEETSRHLRIRWVSLQAGAGGLETPVVPLRNLAPLFQGKVVFLNLADTDGGAGYLLTIAPLDRELPGVGRTAIEISESNDERRTFIRGTIQRAVILALMSFGAMAVVTFVVGRFLLGRPLRELVLKAGRVGLGDLSGPLRFRQRDELGTLANAMNAMCDQLSASRDQLAAETAARLSILEQLRHADRLATVGRLASGIAHEIGTPLAVVAGRGTLIVTGDATGAEAVDNARIVVEQTQRIAVIIRQLLDFARSRSTEKARLDLAVLAEKAVALLVPMAKKSGVTLIASANADTLQAEVDPGQIEQAVTNLVMNAIQATAGGGKVEVALSRGRAKPPTEHGGGEGEFIALTVSDTGSGMDDETKEHVFEPFFTTKDVGAGTGLGLAVTYGIVREHGGWVDVHSEFGRGSRFTIHLPAAEERST